MSGNKQKLTGKDLASAILELDDRPMVPVDVPEWPFELYMRAMTGTERDRFEARFQSDKPEDMKDTRAYIAQMTLVDPEGNRIFSTKDIEALGKKNANALDRVLGKCMEINGFKKDDVQKLEKN